MKIITSRWPLGQYDQGKVLCDGLARLGHAGHLVGPYVGLNGVPGPAGERNVIGPQTTRYTTALQDWLAGNPQAEVILIPSKIHIGLVPGILEQHRPAVLHVAIDKAVNVVGTKDVGEVAATLSAISPQTLVVITSPRKAVACWQGKSIGAYAFDLRADQVDLQEGRGPAFRAAFLATWWETGKLGLALVHGHANAAAVALGRGLQDWDGLAAIVRSLRQY